MGQLQSTSGTAVPKKRLYLAPKKFIRQRKQNGKEGDAFSKGDSSAHNRKRSGELDDYQSADIERLSKTKTFSNNDDDDLQLPLYHQPVFNSRQSETHTSENIKPAATTTAKHNERAFSHDLSARDESLIEESLLQLRDLIENLICSDHADAPIVIEIDSEEKSLKILPQSLLAREESLGKEIAAHHGGKIVIREHFGTPSSGDSIFVDAFSSPITECQLLKSTLLQNLCVSKLDQFDTIEESQNLQIKRNESLDEEEEEEDDEEMPIIKNNNSSTVMAAKKTTNGSDGSDKGMFNVSRVKKIELSEIPLDISTTAAPALEQQQQQTVTSPSNGNSSTGNSVLHRVISLTTANHNNDNNNFTKPTKPTSTTFIPEKLQFSAYEKFEGQMLLNWFNQSIPASLTASLNENELNALTNQYCTNLLIAGIIKPLIDNHDNNSFKANFMYQWTHNKESSSSNVPGRIETGAVWPHNSSNKSNLVSSPSKRLPASDGESKIPKLLPTFSSTPKPRPQTLSSSVAGLNTPENLLLLTETEGDQTKVAELKQKLAKCDTIKDTLMLIKSFLSEYAMQSSESSTNSGVAMTSSLLNGSDTTIFNKQDEQRLLNILEKQKNVIPKSSSPSKARIRTPPKSRTTPSTPTRASSQRIKRNLSSDSVSTAPAGSKENSNSCRRCMQLALASKNSKRFVDKATVMDVDPIEFSKAPETKNVEIQTETLFDGEKKEKSEDLENEANSIPIPPPMPPLLPISMQMPPPPPPPPPPPMNNSNCPKPPPGPPPPPLPIATNGIPAPPPLSMTSSMTNGNKGPCPFPAPPVTLTGPGKLQNASSASSLNSSSSAANGNKPIKPLPFPAFELYQTNTLRKNAVNPPKPMKPLYWTRIVAPIVAQDVTDGKSSPEGTKEEELWKEIDETVLDNIDEFTELFSRQGVLPKAKESVPLPKVKAIKVLDSKRSQNVGIFVRSIHVDFAEIEHAIYHCDTSVVSQETLQNIMSIKATNDELALIKESIAAHNASDPMPPPLDVPEQFLLKLSQISTSAERISCIVFQDEFEEQCTSVSRKLTIVKDLCDIMLDNEGLKEVFSIILTLGNFMNGGNRQRGQADGFGLEILGKLKDVKSKDPKITLLHFIVKTFIERTRKGGCSILDLKLPVPDPIMIDKSLSIDFEECKQQLNLLKNKVEECKKTTEKVISLSTEEHIQPFKDKMEEFLMMASNKVESRFMKIEECKILFIKTLKFYKYMPKVSVPLEDTTPSQFFEYWTSFTNDFNGIYKKEIAILTNELLKKSRQVAKPQITQVKPSQGENNLKARINRLKSRDK